MTVSTLKTLYFCPLKRLSMTCCNMSPHGEPCILNVAQRCGLPSHLQRLSDWQLFAAAPTFLSLISHLELCEDCYFLVATSFFLFSPVFC